MNVKSLENPAIDALIERVEKSTPGVDNAIKRVQCERENLVREYLKQLNPFQLSSDKFEKS